MIILVLLVLLDLGALMFGADSRDNNNWVRRGRP